MMKQSHRLLKRMHMNSMLVKLLLVVLGFSSNCFIVNTHENMHNDVSSTGTYRLLGSQNACTELMWRYMIYQYGFRDAIIYFDQLIKYLVDLLLFASTIYSNNETHHDLVDDVVEKTKEQLIID